LKSGLLKFLFDFAKKRLNVWGRCFRVLKLRTLQDTLLALYLICPTVLEMVSAKAKLPTVYLSSAVVCPTISSVKFLI